ncbi:MAG: chorismate synthase [Bacteroidetes bacterium 4572_112]|nr:MAG: chorismate synthase [Bacteroidetes bacterium 4572_112]
MAGNSFGTIYKITTFGESHGKAIGGIIDGFPSNFKIDISKIEFELLRRSTNQGIYSSSRKETDKIELLSGLFEEKTLGSPIGFMIKNNNAISKDYKDIKDIYRPSHGDYTYDTKYGHRDYRGGGRSSARETAARVVAGAFAKQYLSANGVEIQAWVSQIYNIKAIENNKASFEEIEKSPLRCPDKEAESLMISEIEKAKKEGDTLGGIIRCRISGLNAGIGEPVFDKLNAKLAHAIMSINAVKGIEIGSGFESVEMKGSEHNDEFIMRDGQVSTKSNNSGGIQAGISNGEDIVKLLHWQKKKSIKM